MLDVLTLAIAKQNKGGGGDGGGGGGTTDHRALSNRDAADQHPMSAITGLSAWMQEKAQVIAGCEEDITDLQDGMVNFQPKLTPGNGITLNGANISVTDAYINGLITAKLGDFETLLTALVDDLEVASR